MKQYITNSEDKLLWGFIWWLIVSPLTTALLLKAFAHILMTTWSLVISCSVNYLVPKASSICCHDYYHVILNKSWKCDQYICIVCKFTFLQKAGMIFGGTISLYRNVCILYCILLKCDPAVANLLNYVIFLLLLWK